MSLFKVGDYVETRCCLGGPGETVFAESTAGFVEHVFTSILDEDEEEAGWDENGVYTDFDGSIYYFDDWDVEYSVRLPTGHLLSVMQVNLKAARHPLADAQLPLPLLWGRGPAGSTDGMN